ncbi:hypothetical protein TWF696_001393 [Orbilia brochopaga]|uniref:Uncharacterized protein n=1 Tax=Orbilia brochopaga TaxID=3140254 RepID=A0AAV9UB98_9PEZI
MATVLALGVLGLAAQAAAATTCKTDLCLQALQASSVTSRGVQAAMDCSAYVNAATTAWALTTRTSTTVVTVTLTATNLALPPSPSPAFDDDTNNLAPRAVSTIPDYASRCYGPVGYLSACSCIGVFAPSTSSSSTTTSSTSTRTTGSLTVTTTVTTTVSVPGLYIASPTPLLGNITAGSPTTYDEDFRSILLPFPIRIYNTSLPVNASIFVSVNGFISATPPPSDTYNNRHIPDNATDFPPDAIFPLWSDMLIEAGEQQGIVYGVAGEYPSRTLTIEWLLSSWAAGDSEPLNHFILQFLESDATVVLVRYFSVSNRAAGGGTVGLQSVHDDGSGRAYEWMYGQGGRVYPNLTLTVDMDANRITGTS